MTLSALKNSVLAFAVVGFLTSPAAWAEDAAPQQAAASPAAAEAPKKDAAEWPCVWHKVVELNAATIWDGPSLEKAEGWRNDDNVRNLSSSLIVRKTKLEDAEAAVKKFADGLAADTKDAKLTELFAAVLSRTNDDRKIVIGGIERFHKRQVDRAKTIEKMGGAIPAPVDPKAEKLEKAPEAPQMIDAQTVDKLTDEEEKLKWEIRVFQERQQNLPLACEIPQLMDERAGAIARAIRSHMKS